ncbi:MAG: permease-like cell division protein FtsX [Clostridiales bacterium]|nr:permease-like cell division protein FtsX [Clostridiales bacterium]
MRISSFFYCLKQGFKNIWRNKMFSVASIATMSACIFLFGVFFSIVVNFTHIVKSAEEDVPITVFFNEGITQAKMKEIGEEIASNSKVKSVDFTSAEDAWKDYQNTYFSENPELAEGFADDNPLAGSDNYAVYLNNVEDQQDVASWIKDIDGVRRVRQSEVAAKTLSNFNVLIGYASAGIILILLAVSVFLISNTVTIGITVRKEEIAIMKYIGAKDIIVRFPFIVEGITIGLVGAALPLGVLFFLYKEAVVYINTHFQILQGLITFLPALDVFKVLVPTGLVLGIGIGFIGSFMTTKKHLRV